MYTRLCTCCVGTREAGCESARQTAPHTASKPAAAVHRPGAVAQGREESAEGRESSQKAEKKVSINYRYRRRLGRGPYAKTNTGSPRPRRPG